MPIQSCNIEGKDGFKWGDAGKCYPHNGSEASKKDARKKAMDQGIAIGDIQMSILFDSTIPADVIKTFSDMGYKAHIWAGVSLFNKYSKSFKLANKAGINKFNIHWGGIKSIYDRNEIGMFMTSDIKYKDLDGYTYYEPETMNFADGLVRVVQERWVTNNTDTGPCPLCERLSSEGWVNLKQEWEYTWPGGAQVEVGLPPYRMAHSRVGRGDWKAPDSSCKCYKQYRSHFTTPSMASSNFNRIKISCGCENH